MKNIIKLAAALAVIAAAVFAIVKYADELKKLLDRCKCGAPEEAPAVETALDEAVEETAEPEVTEEAPAAEPEEAPAAEEEPAQEADPAEVTPEDFAD